MMRNANRVTKPDDALRTKRPGGRLFIITIVTRNAIFRKSYIRVIKRGREKTLTYKKLAESRYGRKSRYGPGHTMFNALRIALRRVTVSVYGLVKPCVTGFDGDWSVMMAVCSNCGLNFDDSAVNSSRLIMETVTEVRSDEGSSYTKERLRYLLVICPDCYTDREMGLQFWEANEPKSVEVL